MEHCKTHSAIGTKASALSLAKPSWPSQHDQPTTLHTLQHELGTSENMNRIYPNDTWMHSGSMQAVADFSRSIGLRPAAKKG